MTADTLTEAAPDAPPDPLDGHVITQRLKELAGLTDVPGEMTRLTLSPAHKRAAAQVSHWFRLAGMQVHMDATGSVIGRYAGIEPGARTLIIGSHIDTVRNAGIYDGNLGVLTGLAVVERLRREGRRLPFDLQVVAFADEEGVRFLSTLTSSRALAGRFDPKALEDVDSQGMSRFEALRVFGAPVDDMASCACDPARTLGYVEVHIEQGPVLEAAGLPVGIVTAINGSSRGTIRVRGEAGHSGTMPMAMRHDALTAAAEMVLAVEEVGRSEVDLVATVGVLTVHGAAVNVVPGETRFSLDVRSSSDAQRIDAVRRITERLRTIAARRGVEVDVDMSYEAPAAPCDRALQAEWDGALSDLGLPVLHLPSGAGHDAMVFRDVLPMAMLFVRSFNGSHNPKEYAAPDDIGIAAQALHRFVLRMAGDNA